MKTQPQFVGTRWTLVPSVEPGGKLRLQMNVVVSWLDSDQIATSDPPTASRLSKIELATTVRMLDGQTAVMTG